MPPVTVVFRNDDGTTVAVRPTPRPLAGGPADDARPGIGPMPEATPTQGEPGNAQESPVEHSPTPPDVTLLPGGTEAQPAPVRRRARVRGTTTEGRRPRASAPRTRKRAQRVRPRRTRVVRAPGRRSPR